MSCPNCGAKLEHPTQRFCQDCGSKLPDFSDSSELAQKYSASQESLDVRQLQQKSVKISSPRPLSKASLGLGIVSVIIAVTTFNLGTSFFIEPYLFPLSINQILLVFFGILNIIGTVFGIISKIFNIKAQKNEDVNVAMKAGNLLGIIGTIFNVLLMIAAFALPGFFFV
jgi:hypothetical protein